MDTSSYLALEDPVSRNCEDAAVPVYCRELETSSGTVRYALLPAESSTSATVLVDLGGPGYSLFGTGAIARFASLLPEKLQQLNIIALEEPWVRHPVPAICEEAMSTYYRDSRAVLDVGEAPVAALAAQAAVLSEACALGAGEWGWEPSAYAGAVQSILSTDDLVLDGFIGISFGSIRSTYIAEQAPSWVMLDGPAANGIRADSFLADLEGGAIAQLSSCTSCPQDEATAAQSIEGLHRRLNADPLALNDRSIAVSGADAGPAAFALARLPDEADQASQLLLLQSNGEEQIGEYSDHIWGRYEHYRLSPAYLAYLDEVCSTYTNWADAVQGPGGGTVIGRFLAAFHSPCGDAEDSPRSEATPVYPDVLWSCVLTSVDDPITSSSYAGQWVELLPNAQSRQRAGAQHASGDFSACLNGPWAD